VRASSLTVSANGAQASGVPVGQRIFPPDFGDSQAGNAAPAYLFNNIMKKANRMGTFVEFGCADGVARRRPNAPRAKQEYVVK
jgi:hypothetical protein